MNPAMLEASDDLTNLSHLNEPAGTCALKSSQFLVSSTHSPIVLHAIRLRYAQNEIYTYSGIVLIATNPFARVDSLYEPGMIQIYAGKQRASQAPHLFAIAEEAFTWVSRAHICHHTQHTDTRGIVTCSAIPKTRQWLYQASRERARLSAQSTLCGTLQHAKHQINLAAGQEARRM